VDYQSIDPPRVIPLKNVPPPMKNRTMGIANARAYKTPVLKQIATLRASHANAITIVTSPGIAM
jgi:hypothetical protein